MLQIYEDYRDGKTIDQPHYGNRPVNFDFLGVWDSVGALAFGRTIGDFHRINPGNVLRVAHALALDEERERFEPSYWNKPAGANTQVDEVWFSGCHTNIGGGYCDTNLSNIALIWVLKAAQDAGISIDLRGLPDFDWEKSHSGRRRDSYAEFYSELGLVGGIAKLFNIKRAARVIRQSQRIHQSVIEIIQDKTVPGLAPYVPTARYNGDALSADVNPGIEPWGVL